MEVELSGFTFFSTFDSGNLGRVETVDWDSSGTSTPTSTRTGSGSGASSEEQHAEFNLWTKPDCEGTEFENGNRTWFYFGIRGGPPGSLIKFNVKNLNKQSKLFSQGMVPIYMMVPGKNHWERLQERPTFSTEDNNFVVSFRLRTGENPKAATYVAFTYPYGYKELQSYLGKLERKYGCCNKSFEELSTQNPDKFVYFHREVMCHSFEGRRVDLLTLSGPNGILADREDTLSNMFPGDGKRPHKFDQKKIVFLSARVHPGETQSSFVMNGFIKFLLRENDPRATTLRKKYVFKLIPMLNPDGVVRGHYRTDMRGVNLNRVYMRPSLKFHSTIYAAKKLLLYSHYGYEVKNIGYFDETDPCPPPKQQSNDDASFLSPEKDFDNESSNISGTSSVSGFSRWLRSEEPSPVLLPPPSNPIRHPPEQSSSWYEMTETSRCSEGDESIFDFSIGSSNTTRSAVIDDDENSQVPEGSGSADSTEEMMTSFTGALQQTRRRLDFEAAGPSSTGLDTSNMTLTQKIDSLTAPAEEGKSGLFMYVDIHGHASRRGIFMYGNHFPDVDKKIEAMLLPKLMSINCANFDFPACNFTERNMYLKDRHTGAGREGSGRVSVFKATGVVYSYTLEANFNTGRIVNAIPMASRDAGRATPPPIYDAPPKYTPQIYEDAGKALAVSILDLTESNPWSRITCSACKNLKGVKDWIRKYIKQSEEAAKKPPLNRVALRSSSRRRRTESSSSLGTKRSPVKSTTVAASTKLKSPSSPDSYRPVSKIPRKASAAKNSQSATSPPAARPPPLKKARSIQGALPPTTTATAKPKGKKKTKTTLSRSRSQSSGTSSRPSSRAASPRGSASTGVKKGGKKTLKKASSLTELNATPRKKKFKRKLKAKANSGAV